MPDTWLARLASLARRWPRRWGAPARGDVGYRPSTSRPPQWEWTRASAEEGGGGGVKQEEGG